MDCSYLWNFQTKQIGLPLFLSLSAMTDLQACYIYQIRYHSNTKKVNEKYY